MPEFRPFLLTAAGLSDKAMNHLTEEDQTAAIRELIDNFLKPAGSRYIDEAVFRYLLIKGDAVGGTMRNRIGDLGQEKLIRGIFSAADQSGLLCDWLPKRASRPVWQQRAPGETDIESQVKALHWRSQVGERILIFNMTVPTVRKNVDLCLYQGGIGDYARGRIVRRPDRAVMLGELKGGIDPAGADEHWKTGNTALLRIRESFEEAGYPDVKTSFVAAAIASDMAGEIYGQLTQGTLSNAANLNNVNQLAEYCRWLISL